MIRRPLGQPLERDVSDQVEQAAALFGVTLHRRNTGVGFYPNEDGSARPVYYGRPGDSDRTGTLPDGRRIDVEVKRPGQRPTPKQLARLHEVNASGGVGLWTDDAATFVRLLPAILAGAWIEIDTDGVPYVCDGKD